MLPERKLNLCLESSEISLTIHILNFIVYLTSKILQEIYSICHLDFLLWIKEMLIHFSKGKCGFGSFDQS